MTNTKTRTRHFVLSGQKRETSNQQWKRLVTARLRRIDGVEEGDGMRCGRYVVAVVALIVIGSAAALFVSGQILLVAVIFGVVCGMVAWSAPRLDPAARDRSLAETSIGGS